MYDFGGKTVNIRQQNTNEKQMREWDNEVERIPESSETKSNVRGTNIHVFRRNIPGD